MSVSGNRTNDDGKNKEKKRINCEKYQSVLYFKGNLRALDINIST